MSCADRSGRAKGLSPRTRGSPRPAGAGADHRRSIPANAGKPHPVGRSPRAGRVYPRERGEALPTRPPAVPSQGLSPRTRGSLIGGIWSPRKCGSIPANAGKPHRRGQDGTGARVYPRERGEAMAAMSAAELSPGLSPRTRGSRICRPSRWPSNGSIPANAGKPWSPTPTSTMTWVYPRERGEAAPATPVQSAPTGLSPRTRGSLAPGVAPSRRTGSIPANAGKPGFGRACDRPCWVYPRERGEANSGRCSASDDGGLSPRTRGSLAAQPAGVAW